MFIGSDTVRLVDRYIALPDGLLPALGERVTLHKGIEPFIGIAPLNPRTAVGAIIVELRAGVLRLSKSYKHYARLDGEVLVIGCLNYIELWNPDLFKIHSAFYLDHSPGRSSADPQANGSGWPHPDWP